MTIKLEFWYPGLIIIAANAGGAWSPIGDVTTTMLWMGEKVTTVRLIEYLILPALVCMIIPTFIASFLPAFKGNFNPPAEEKEANKMGTNNVVLRLNYDCICASF